MSEIFFLLALQSFTNEDVEKWIFKTEHQQAPESGYLT